MTAPVKLTYIDGANEVAAAVAETAGPVIDQYACKPTSDELKEIFKIPQTSLFLRLAARTVFESEVAFLLCGVLKRRHDLDDGKVDCIRVALEEALANAVLHGSLELGSCFDHGLEGVKKYSEEMQTRLANPYYGRRAVWIKADKIRNRLNVLVRDQGPGFRVRPKYEPALDEGCGRGLIMMRRYADDIFHSHNGRQVRLSFSL